MSDLIVDLIAFRTYSYFDACLIRSWPVDDTMISAAAITNATTLFRVEKRDHIHVIGTDKG